MIKTDTVSLKKISDLDNYVRMDILLKDCVAVLEEELDYFFTSKAQLIDFFVKGIDFKSLSLNSFQEKANKVFLSENDLALVLSKIEKRIQKEINRSIFSIEFKFSKVESEGLLQREGVSVINSKLKTFKLSNFVQKIVDMAWKKTAAEILPKELKKLSPKFKAGNYFLAYLGVSPKEVENNAKESIARILLGTLKQNKVEIFHILKEEIVENLTLIELENNHSPHKDEVRCKKLKVFKNKTA